MKIQIPVTVPIAVFLFLLVFKLVEIINWSWWLVTLPIWGWVLIAFIGATHDTIKYAAQQKRRNKRR